MPRFRAAAFLVMTFASMIAGMLGKAYYDHLTKTNQPFSFDQILISLIVSPMIYGAILGLVRSADTVPGLILAFQNGFFWQDIFTGLKSVR